MSEVKKERDVRLDFFRGLTMFIIFVAHGPDNPWNNWIPARFGFSSGAELFVFCSGFASSIAFGGVFMRRGLLLGTARIAFRCWQVYWANISVFLVTIGVIVVANGIWPDGGFDKEPFGELFADPMRGIFGMLTLTYQPAYLDILPMYLVILALIPLMMMARRIHALLPFCLSIGLYLSAWFLNLSIPGNPWSGMSWFFNPFAWQLIFFCGFSFGLGWLKPPAFGQSWLIMLCLAGLAISVPLNFWGIVDNVPMLQAARDWLLPELEKTNLHILRVVHFLALAYVVLSIVNPHRQHLAKGVGRIIVTVGRQSLAVFLVSIISARCVSIAIIMAMGTTVEVAFLNLLGFATIIATAYAVTWFKSQPWSMPKRPAIPAELPARVSVPAE